jgi:hypothetical protein
MNGNQQTADRSDDNRQPRFLDPDFSFAAFSRDLLGGNMRWFCTALAAISAGLLIWLSLSGDEAAVYFPVTLRGRGAWAALVRALLLWCVLATVNWINWVRAGAARLTITPKVRIAPTRPLCSVSWWHTWTRSIRLQVSMVIA